MVCRQQTIDVEFDLCVGFHVHYVILTCLCLFISASLPPSPADSGVSDLDDEARVRLHGKFILN